MEATQQGAPDMEARFQSLFDNGAFDPQASQNQQTSPEQTSKNVQPESPPEPETSKAPETSPEVLQETHIDEPENWESLDHFLQANELNPDEFRQIPVKVKIDGQEKAVPLSDVIKSYQLEGHVNNKSIELSEARKAFESEQEAARTLMKEQLQQNAALGELAMQQLTHEYQQIDWNGLRASNPGEYAALITEYNNRAAQIQNHLQTVQKKQQETEQAEHAKKTQNLQQERERLFSAKPEWKNPEAFAKDASDMTQYAKTKGYTDAEIGSISDHRWMQILHDAARYAALQAKTPEATKRVREAPKMQAKPGTRTNRDPQVAARQQAFERLKTNPRDIDAQSAAFEFLINS